MWNKIASIFFMALMLGKSTVAQTVEKVEMADVMRASGKIYVVVAVLLLLFIGIVIYLLRLDRKITAIEKEIKEK